MLIFYENINIIGGKMINFKSMTSKQRTIFQTEVVPTLNKKELIKKIQSNKVSKKELVEFYLKTFISMRDDWSNILPTIDIRLLESEKHNRRIASRYKCSGNFIVGLSLRLEAVVLKKLVIDKVLIEKIDQFRKHDFRFSHGEFTTQEEIDMINDILNDVIEYLQKK